MPSGRTFDQRNEQNLNDVGLDPDSEGMMRYNTGRFRFQDSIGVFDPRNYWASMIDGPEESFAATLYQTVNYVAGTIFVQNVRWYRDAAKTKLVAAIDATFTGNNYVLPTTIVYALYNAAGTAIVHTCTDTIAYSGINVSGVTRVFT